MSDNEKTKEQLLLEIAYLKQVILEWENKYKALEAFAKATEERFLNITSAVSDYIFSVHIVDGNPVETVHGPACYAITGYTPREFYEDPYLWINMVYPEDRAMVLDHVAKILAGKEVKPLEHRIIRKDGVIRWVRNTPVCQYDEEGKLKTYDGLIQDITDFKRAIDTLKLSEEKFQKAFRCSPDIITITTIIEGRFIDVNDAFQRETGYSRDEVLGAKIKDFDIYVDYSVRAEIVEELLSKGKVSNKELKLRTKRGDILVVLASAEPIVMGDEQCMITVARDITAILDPQGCIITGTPTGTKSHN
jgi:PAS domain S-box-containing protein